MTPSSDGGWGSRRSKWLAPATVWLSVRRPSRGQPGGPLACADPGGVIGSGCKGLDVGPALQNSLQNPVQPVHAVFAGVVLQSMLAGLLADGGRKIGLLSDADHGLGHGIDVVLRSQPSRHPVLDNILDAPVTGGHHRESPGHCLANCTAWCL